MALPIEGLVQAGFTIAFGILIAHLRDSDLPGPGDRRAARRAQLVAAAVAPEALTSAGCSAETFAHPRGFADCLTEVLDPAANPGNFRVVCGGT